MQNDRELAYEQNVTALEAAWHDRIRSFAREALKRHDRDGAVEVVAQRLLNSERWQNVAAADVSDIALEAVDQIAASERAWIADRAMIEDMERDGLL